MKKYILIGPIVLVLFWFLATRLHLVDTFFLPDPFAIFGKLIEILLNGEILFDLLATLRRMVISFIIAMGIGVPVGLMLGGAEKVYSAFEFVIDFFRSTPSTALFPVFLLIFGVNDASKIGSAIFTSALIIIFNTAYGVMNSGKSKRLAAKIMGASKMQIFRWITFWESLPQTFIGLRGAVSMSLVVIVVTEMFIGSTVGLGRRIIDAQITYDIPLMYAIVLLSGIVGYVFNFSLVILENKVVHWVRR